MSFNEVMAELPKLTAEQRDLLRIRLAELAGEDWMDADGLTPEQKMLVEERIADHERNPAACLGLAEVESRLRAKFGQ